MSDQCPHCGHLRHWVVRRGKQVGVACPVVIGRFATSCQAFWNQTCMCPFAGRSVPFVPDDEFGEPFDPMELYHPEEA